MTTEPLSRMVHTLSRTLAATDLAGHPDGELLDRFRTDRDPVAFEAIVRRHGPRVLGACRKVLPDEADAEDAFQATFVILMRDPRSVRRAAALGTWLFGVAHRVALQARIARKRRDRIEAKASARRADASDLSWPEACAILHEELDRLPDAHRLPLLLCYLDGLTRDEAAARLGRTLGSVKRSLEVGRDRLRKRLVRRGVTLSAGLLSAVAVPEDGGPTAELVEGVIRGAIRPGAAGLARAVRAGSAWRWVAAGMAASVLAVTAALGFPAGQKPPTEKKAPAPAAAKSDTPPADGPKEGRIAFAGRAVDPDGKPVKGAKLYLLRWGEMWPGPDADPLARVVDTSAKATTDADGRYRFDVPAKDYPDRWWSDKPQLVAASPGFGLGLLPVGRTGAADGTVALAADHPITGRIINLEGKPVPGATVRVVAVRVPPTGDLAAFVKKAEAEGMDMASNWVDTFFPRAVGYLSGRPAALPAATTDARGRFELRGIGRERVATIQIEGDAIAGGRLTVLTQDGPGGMFPKTPLVRGKPGEPFYRTPVEYVAAPGQVIEGVVTDKETGKPIPGIPVAAPGAAGTTTDREGRYRLSGLRPGECAVYVRVPADVPYHSGAAFGGSSNPLRPSRLDIALAPAVWLTGKVVDQRAGRPVAGATVKYHAAAGNPRAVVERDPDLRPMQDVRTGPDGAFRLRGFAGKGWVEVYLGRSYVWACDRDTQGDTDDRKPISLRKVADGYIAGNMCNAAAAVDVDPAKPKEYVVTVDRGVSATVRLTDPDGKPLTGVIAYGAPQIDYRWTKPASSDTLSVTALNPDRPRPLLFLHPERGLGARFQPKTNDPGPWTVQLKPTATVTGRFADADGQPIVDAKVYAFPRYPWQSDKAPTLDGPEFQVKTDAEGRFKSPLVIGDAESVIGLYAPGQRREFAERPVRLRPGETKDLGTIKPDPPRQ